MKGTHGLPPGVWNIGTLEDGRHVLVSVTESGRFRRVETPSPDLEPSVYAYMRHELVQGDKPPTPSEIAKPPRVLTLR